jgi:hypothetical protein
MRSVRGVNPLMSASAQTAASSSDEGSDEAPDEGPDEAPGGPSRGAAAPRRPSPAIRSSTTSGTNASSDLALSHPAASRRRRRRSRAAAVSGAAAAAGAVVGSVASSWSSPPSLVRGLCLPMKARVTDRMEPQLFRAIFCFLAVAILRPSGSLS